MIYIEREAEINTSDESYDYSYSDTTDSNGYNYSDTTQDEGPRMYGRQVIYDAD